MKKLSSLSLSLFLIIWHYKVYAQFIPDVNFRQVINSQCPTCIDGNGFLKPDAKTLTSLLADNSNITDITGVIGFTNLEQFFCSKNQITFLPPLPDSLNVFYCNDNLLASLPALLPSKLKEFKCEDNLLTSLPDLPNKLILFFCSGNSISSLPLLPSTIENLTCNDNLLTSLPPLPESLTSLHCNINLLKTLPALPENISKVFCSQNQIVALPEIPATVDVLDVSGNPISCLPVLPSNLQTLDLDFTFINCLPNIPLAFLSNPPFPLCISDSDVSCAANPTISGNAFIDFNGNGLLDGSDFGISELQISTGSGNWLGITDSKGDYKIKAGFENTYTVSPQEPAGNYTVNPVSYSYTFDDSSYQVITNANFALVPDGDNYDLNTSLAAGEIISGDQTIFAITYSNNSAYTIDGTIQFIFDPNLNFISAFPSPDGVFAQTLTWDFNSLAPFQSQSIDIVMKVDGGLTAGTELTNSVNSTLLNHTDLLPSNNSEILSSKVEDLFVANYMTVSCDSVKPEEIWNGKMLEYVLTFQNTGSITATKIEIFDTLSSSLDYKTLEMLASSFNYTLDVINTDYNADHPLILHWTFDNVNLPPSNVDAIASQGLLRFKIRPRTDLALNTLIYNKAEILFDYSSIPVTSNQVLTVVTYPVGINAVAGNEHFSVSPNPFSNNVNFRNLNVDGDDLKIEITDAIGKIVFQKTFSSDSKDLDIDLSTLPQGAYIMMVKNEKGTYSSKLFKQ